MVKASLSIGDQSWAVQWDLNTNEIEYMIAQFAFEARRAAERNFQGNR